MYIGPNTIKKNLVFGYDSGYGAASNHESTRFYAGEPTSNVIPNTSNPNLSVYGWYGYGWSGGMIVNTEENAFELTATNGWHNRRYNHGITSGGTVTVSFDYKLKSLGTDPVATSHQTYMFILNGTHLGSYTNYISSISHPDFISGEWKTFIGSYTANSDSNLAIGVRGKDSAGLSDTVYIKNLQVEAKGHRTPFVEGSRSSTKSLIDLKRTTDIDLSNMSFDSTGQPTFNGVDDYMSMSSIPNIPTTQITCEAVINPSRTPSTGTVRGTVIGDQSSLYLGIINSIDGGTGHALHWALPLSNGSRVASWHGSIPKDKFTHIVGTYDGSTSRAYINGVQVWYASTSGNVGGTTYNIGIYNNRTNDGLHNFEGSIPTAKIYNLALSAQEVQQNFNAYKNRFNI